MTLFYAAGQQQDPKVSLEQVLNNPKEYHGKLIEVRGFFAYQFENCALYSSQKSRYGDGIWVTPTLEMAREHAKLNRHYILLVGVFDADRHGHLSQFKGELTVRKFELVQDDTSPSPSKDGAK